MFGLGASELLIILVIVVLLFGASKIPELGKSLGSGLKNFKEGLRQDDAPPAPPPPTPRRALEESRPAPIDVEVEVAREEAKKSDA